ncbi:hypothetical protein JOC36_000144 [Weissella uvarum]|uniref:hypothetical protein n=1 Tax=Weissella uvarum TaxID=1479233 RepID=UPI00195FDDBF|nr:hypothetical protein [Weissella uvarum]MBM7616611.1 hypothetical protein [Weissella uvarum]MCM0594930.1 hypothetical protein [Weissella uvarum]
MPKLSKLQQAVYDLLPKGAERPRPQDELIYLLEQSEQFKVTPRLVSQIINDLILKNQSQIGSSRNEPTGYYLIETPQELQNAVRPLSRQANAELKRVDTLLQIDLTEFWSKEKADV